MTRADYTEIVFLLDRSGSMGSMGTEPMDAYNAFVEEQKKVVGECMLTTILFDHEYSVLDREVPIETADKLTDGDYKPRGTTALWDSMGRSIDSTGQRFAEMDEEDRPSKIIFVTLTDGLENASRDYTRSRVLEMVKVQTEQFGWSFVHLGASVESASEAYSVGLRSGNVAQYDAKKSGSLTRALRGVSANVASYRTSSTGKDNLAQ